MWQRGESDAVMNLVLHRAMSHFLKGEQNGVAVSGAGKGKALR